MRGPQITAAALGLLLAVVLYTIPRRTPEKITRYDEWRDSAIVSLPQDVSTSLEMLIDEARKSSGAEQAENYRALADAWRVAGWPVLEAEYLRMAAEADPDEASSWGKAGDAFLALLPGEWDDGEVVDLGMHALYCYERALERDSDNVHYKLGLSECYTDYQGNVMQGVFLLREIADESPNHPEANLRLGRFALMSGQIDRARIRFSSALEGDSLNLQARIMLAEVLAGTGDPIGAREILEAGSGMFSDSSSLEQLRTAIDKFSQ